MLTTETTPSPLLTTLLTALHTNKDLAPLISLPPSDAYTASNTSYFSAFPSSLSPLLILSPTTTLHVQSLLRNLRPLLLSNTVKLAVRGGGHTPFASAANINGGVTLDLRGLKGVTLKDGGLVEIAVGETWTSVYTELDKHSLTVAGGRVGRVGVPGFLLGGGLSMYSTREGFACDGVVEFGVVLGSGEFVRANEAENADLWWALRGGGNNFGVVVSVTMRAFGSGGEGVWGGLVYYPAETFDEVLGRAVELVSGEEDEDVHVMCSAGYGFGHQAVSVVMYQTKGVINPPSLRGFTEGVKPRIEGMGTLRVGKHSEFCDELSKFSVDGLRQFWGTLTIKADIGLIREFHERWQATLAGIKDAEGFIFSFGFHPLTKALLRNSRAKGGNAMDIDPEDGPLFVVLINPVWTLAVDDERIYKAVEELIAGLRELAGERGLLHRYVFANYAHWKDDVMAGYGKDGLERLKKTSEKYDAEGLFQKGVPGGFKLK